VLPGASPRVRLERAMKQVRRVATGEVIRGRPALQGKGRA
jgi:hypothetical protein